MLQKKSKVIISLLAVTAVIGTLFSGCQKSTSTTSNALASKQVIVYNLGAEPKTIDPALNDAVDGSTVISNAFEGLMRLNDKDLPVYGAADKYTVSSDGLKYTFHIRKDAKWSDGKPVKAQDFEYAWKRALDPKTASSYAYQLYYIKNGQGYNESSLPADQKTPGVKPATKDEVGVKAVDDSNLEVELESSTPFFMSLMAFPTYFPVREDIVEKYGDKWATDPESYVSNGPFKLSKWKSKDTITFVKNDKYWNTGSIKLSEIDYKVLDDQTSYMSAFTSGQMDLIESPPNQQIPTLISKKIAKVYPQLGTYYIELNISPEFKKSNPEAYKALSNVKVREALSLAIDRTLLVKNITKGGEKEATAFVPNGISENKSGKDFRDKSYYAAKGDAAKAKKLLAEAGYPNGNGFPKIEYLYNNMQSHQDIAQALQDMWKKNLNIDVSLKSQEWKVFQTTRTNKQYEIARGGWLADYTDPITFLDLFYSKSGNNDPGYNSPEYDAKIDAANKESDTAKRMKDLHDAEDILMKDIPVIPLYFYTNVVCKKDYVKDVHISPLGFIYFDKTYITKH